MADYVIDGARIAGIPDLYAQLNSLFMADEDWRLGASLDALDDLLYGGFGALSGDEAPRVVWRDAAHSRRSLGAAETERWLREKLSRPAAFDAAAIGRQLEAVRAGLGPTYFDLVLEVFAGHPEVGLDLR